MHDGLVDEAPRSITLHEAADRLGVHYMTVYRYVRLGILPADKVGGSWQVDPSDLSRVGARPRPTTSTGPGRPDEVSAGSGRRRRAPWAGRLEQRMLAGDAAGSWQVVEAAMASGYSPADVYVEILGPALHAIGAGWRRGQVGIEQEHLATAAAASIIGRLGPRFRRRGLHRGTILVAMPVGDHHGLGAAMLSDILRGHGYAVLNVGADTPPSSLVVAMARVPDLVGLVVSVVNRARLRAAAQLIRAARRQDPAVAIVAGGFAVPDEATALGLGADGWVADARRLAPLIDRLVVARRPGSPHGSTGPRASRRSTGR
jgi:excisionase family DNA binding protein